MISLDVTAAQMQSIMTAMGSPQIVYTNTGGGTEVFSMFLLDAKVTDTLFFPKKADGTYLEESVLKAAFPSAIKVNAIG